MNVSKINEIYAIRVPKYAMLARKSAITKSNSGRTLQAHNSACPKLMDVFEPLEVQILVYVHF